MLYEIHAAIAGSYENVSTDDGAPLQFATLAEAVAELLDTIIEMQANGMAPNAADFTIIEVQA